MAVKTVHFIITVSNFTTLLKYIYKFFARNNKCSQFHNSWNDEKFHRFGNTVACNSSVAKEWVTKPWKLRKYWPGWSFIEWRKKIPKGKQSKQREICLLLEFSILIRNIRRMPDIFFHANFDSLAQSFYKSRVLVGRLDSGRVDLQSTENCTTYCTRSLLHLRGKRNLKLLLAHQVLCRTRIWIHCTTLLWISHVVCLSPEALSDADGSDAFNDVGLVYYHFCCSPQITS